MIQNNFYFYNIAVYVDYFGFYPVKNIFYFRFRSILMSILNEYIKNIE